MRILLLAASALALSIGTSADAQGNRGGGGGGKPAAHQGGGHGGGHQARHGGGGGGGGQQAHRGGGGGQHANRGHGGGGGQQAHRGRGGDGQQVAQRGGGNERVERGNGQARQAQRVAQRGGPEREMRGNGRGQQAAQRGPDGRGQGRGGSPARVQDDRRERLAVPNQSRERGPRLTQRRAAPVANANEIARLRWEPNQSVGRGCPPGLAKKNNGCMPPGQVQEVAQQQNWYRDWWSYPASTNYLYNDGYLVRWDGDSAANYIPLLGGALWPGQAWPEDYQSYDVPEYFTDYYGLQDQYDYRFADGAIYGVNPTNQLIQQVVALVTGDEWSIGQRVPEGYDIYNVPYEFRDQYQDTGEANYRYSDGYVYQVDPTTQLIQAAIQLIT